MELLDRPLEDLCAEARALRDEGHGRLVTFSPKVFIPLTTLCRDRCGYCTFAESPARAAAPYLAPADVLRIARAGAGAGCHEALFTLGERPELRYAVAREWLREHGYDSTVAYLAAMCRLVVEETGLLPHANAGALDADELAVLRPVTAVRGDASVFGWQGSASELEEVRRRIAARPQDWVGQEAATAEFRKQYQALHEGPGSPWREAVKEVRQVLATRLGLLPPDAKK